MRQRKKTTWVIVLFAAAVIGPLNCFADVVFENTWSLEAGDSGSFSDPFQIIAAQFSLEDNANADLVTFHGAFFDLGDPFDVGDIRTFDIVFYEDNNGIPGVPFYTEGTTGSIIEDTGINDNRDDRFYLIGAAFPAVPLLGGTNYWISIINSQDAATFRWSNGVDFTNSHSSNDGTSGPWSPADPESVRSQTSFTLIATVPEPSLFSVLVVGVVLLCPRRVRC